MPHASAFDARLAPALARITTRSELDHLEREIAREIGAVQPPAAHGSSSTAHDRTLATNLRRRAHLAFEGSVALRTRARGEALWAVGQRVARL